MFELPIKVKSPLILNIGGVVRDSKSTLTCPNVSSEFPKTKEINNKKKKYLLLIESLM